MQKEIVTVRLNFSSREIEVSGSSEAVDQWIQKLDKYIVGFAARPNQPAVEGRQNQRRVAGPDTPATFGEYFHRFPRTITDVDRILIAGYFAQQRTEENQFTTAETRELLEQQNVRVGNPSECVRRNLEARRVFPLTRGAYRVAEDGIAYLESIIA